MRIISIALLISHTTLEKGYELMIRSISMQTLLAAAASCFLWMPAQGALVYLAGTIQSSSPGATALGQVPPAQDFTLELDFTPETTFTTINGGQFTFGALAPIAITTGDISFFDLGANDQADFFASTMSPDGDLSFGFTGDLFTSEAITVASIEALAATGPVSFSARFGADSYFGTVSAVPEPSAGIAILIGLAASAGFRRKRQG